MTTDGYRRLDAHDVDADLNAIEDEAGDVDEFYRIVKLIASAVTFIDGEAYTEE